MTAAHRADRRTDGIVHDILTWYAAHARPLPWRAAEVTPWGVLVSEVMLQQTPVARVEPVWHEWLGRWPTPTALADDEASEAVRAWGRLGYPRRALRLHAAATAIRDEHGGLVPSDHDVLLTLPGIGSYTAAAVASFGFGGRHVVLDTNVRRVLARLGEGRAFAPNHLTRAEGVRAAGWLPPKDADAAAWAAASMELGALVCTADAPACDRCPVSDRCAWVAAGRPAWDGPPRRGQAWAGTDRQCRGVLLDALRRAEAPLPRATLLATWRIDPDQAERALTSLLADRLCHTDADGAISLERPRVS